MAITTKTTYTLQSVTYGCSDPCSTLFANGDLTPSELARFSWCRWEDRYLDCVSSTNIDVSTQQGSAVMNLLSYMQPTGATRTTHYVKDRIPTKKPYAFNILIYGNGGDYNITSSNGDNYRIVTSCSDFQSLYVKVDKYQDARSTQAIQFPTARTINVNDLTWSRNAIYNTITDTYTDYITVWTVYVIDEETFFITKGSAFTNKSPCCYQFANKQHNIIPTNRLNISTEQWNYQNSDITNYDGTLHMLRWCSNDFNIEGTVTWDNDVTKYACWDVTSDISVVMRGYWREYYYSYYLRTEESVKNSIAYMGLRWRYENGDTEHIYTPIIDEDNFVTGYSTDPDAVTKLNDIIDVTGNNVSPLPPVPPTPTPSDDDYADMGIGVGTGVGGYTTFALMTLSDLVDLLDDFNANLQTGMSVVNNFICLYKLGPLASSLCTTRVGNIIMSANASTNFVSIRADYNIVTDQKDVITLGSYNVPRMTNTFYDFAPYSTYELFIPCCGWVPLPDTVAGRTIDVYMIIDLSSCTCKGICRIGGTTVAEASGVLGVSVPFYSTDSGLKRAADVMAVTQMISGIAQGAVGAGSGAGALVVSGSANALQGLEQLYINGNTNYTAIKGGNGDITAVGNGEYCTIKITHPKVDEVVNNSRFGHTVGYLCNTVGKIKDFKGLTVCANPHVTGIDCTESEKEEIKRLLEEGIIVN